MLRKILSSVLFSFITLSACACLMPVRAAEAPSDSIVGEWMWGSTIADLGTDGAEKIMARCAEMGVTDVYLLVKGTAGKLGYLNTQYKDALSRTNRDVLQEAIDAAHPRGIRIHAWICNMEDENYKAKHPEAGMWHYIRARDNNRINLYDEGYVKYMSTIAAELAAYDIDGLHFDYIRYNHLANGWSEVDIAALTAMGANMDRVKELVETTFGYHGRTANSSYIFNALKNGDPDALIVAQYRRNNVKEYAAAVIAAAKAVKPNLIISAATMPEGAYDDTSFADLHYGQSYEDAAKLYDYVCPMGYSSSYGKSATWVTTLTKNAIDMGNKVVMGLQAYETATTSRLMTEIQNLRQLSRDSKYGQATLGFVIFRTGTIDYAKITCDTQENIITVKVINLGSSQSCRKIRLEASGIRILDAVAGHGIGNAKITVASNGSSATVSGNNLLNSSQSGYIYLKYDGELSDNIPLQVLVTRQSDVCTYNVTYFASDDNSDMGTPPSFEEQTTTAVETTTPAEVTTPATAETTPAPVETPPTPADTTLPAPKGGCGAVAGLSSLGCMLPVAAAITKKKKPR